MGVDYYGYLELNRSATDADIKKAYRRLSLMYHPDRSGYPEDKCRFAFVCESYDVLSNLARKAIFDQFGEEGLKSGLKLSKKDPKPEEIIKPYVFHGDCDKVFREFFGVDNPFADYFMPNIDYTSKFIGPDGKPRKYPGPPLEVDVFVTLEDILYGREKRPKVGIKTTNFVGNVIVEEKPFSIKLPMGCPEGRKYTFKNRAHKEAVNMIPGDLTFTVKLLQHPIFVRDGDDLLMKKSITLDQAVIGTRFIDIVTLEGRKFRIAIHDYINKDYRKIIPDLGLPPEKDPSKRGNLVIVFDVTIPDSLLEQQMMMKKLFK